MDAGEFKRKLDDGVAVAAMLHDVGSPIASHKKLRSAESPFDRVAGSVTYSGASPAALEWLAPRSPGPRLRRHCTTPPATRYAKMPSLLADDDDISTTRTPARLPGSGGGCSISSHLLDDAHHQQHPPPLSPPEVKDERIQAALGLRQISSSRSPSANGSPNRGELKRPKGQRRPPTTSVYINLPRRDNLDEDENTTPTTESQQLPPPHQQQQHQHTPIERTPQQTPCDVPRKRHRQHAPPTKPCNCKRSRCLKLYCECFAAGVFCKQCNCCHCLNVIPPSVSAADILANATARQEREGPDGPRFEGRVRHCDAGGTPEPVSALSSNSKSSSASRRRHSTRRPNAGCFCKRSRCLKKYCECFEAGALCDASCRCEKCLNFEGSADLAQARAKLSKAEAKLGTALGASPRSGAEISPAPVATTPASSTAVNVVSAQLETPVNPKKSVAKLAKREAWERTARQAWTETTQRALQRKTDELVDARQDADVLADRATAAAAAADAAITAASSSSNRLKADASPAVEAALRIATAAAVEGTRASFSLGQSELESTRVARAVAKAAYDAVLETQHEAMATAAAGWGLAAARAAQRARGRGDRECAVIIEARDTARRAAFSAQHSNDTLNELQAVADQNNLDANRAACVVHHLARSLDLLRTKLQPTRLRDKLEKHVTYLRDLRARDGELAPGLPIHRPLALRALQCLPSEDLYGACLVCRDWTTLALDRALWDFFPNQDSTPL